MRNNVNRKVIENMSPQVMPNNEFEYHMEYKKLQHIEDQVKIKKVKSLDNLFKKDQYSKMIGQLVMNQKCKSPKLNTENEKRLDTLYENKWKSGIYDDRTMTDKQKKSRSLHIFNTIKEANQNYSLENVPKEELKVSNIMSSNKESVKYIDKFLKSYKIEFEDKKPMYADKLYEGILKKQWDFVQSKRNEGDYYNHVDDWMNTAISSYGHVDNAELMRLQKISSWENVKK